MMQLATKNDKSRVIRIFQEAFIDNPHILYLLGNKRLKRKIAIMTRHVIRVAIKRGGIYFSEDREGVLVVFEASKLQLTFIEKCSQYWMALRCFAWRRLPAISRTEKQVQLLRTCQPHDLYVWFYAVSDKALGGPAARELMKDLFSLADRQNASIYAETSLSRNVLIYERFGFECYHQKDFDGFDLYHLRKQPTKD
ncbi:MAG: hypothetical protein ACKOWM_06200 [Sphingomonadales bacterium]|jgi:hypothetical protein